MEKKKAKKKLRFGGILVLILFGYLLFSFGYYLVKLPIKQIEIKNNYYLTDDYIIDLLDLNKKTLLEFSTYKAEKKLNKEDLVVKSEVKKNIFGKIVVNVNEQKILFYNWNNKKIILKDKEVEYKDSYLGVPALINYVQSDIYKMFLKKFSELDRNIISMISEIEYDPDKLNDVVLDETRFLLRMNDGIKVYVNVYNLKKMNNYLEIYDAILKTNSPKNACLYLDSNSKNYIYGSCDKATAIESSESNE